MSKKNKPQQLNLFGEDFRSDKEIFADFSQEFISENSLNLHYPELFTPQKSPIFFKTLKNLYTSHVIHGAWTEELFSKATMHTIKNRKTLCTQNIQESASIINRKPS